MIGAYRLTERVGKGGFSEVWSAWDTHLHRLVAIKLVPRAGNDAHSTIQFGREATIVTRLEHPHILPLFDFGETPEIRYLVMRYVTGGSLADRLAHGPLSPSELVRYMMPVAETLDYIHEQHIVHRDLKPSNILLDAQDLPYVTDFGLAKILSDETQGMHSGSGTLTYMPPEQFIGGALSARSDIYSFGILLYELFTGSQPYEGRVALGMRQISHREHIPDIFATDARFPSRINAFLRQLTDPEPRVRPPSARQAMEEIAKLLHGTEESNASTGTGISYALESAEYRQREAKSLLEQSLGLWQQGEFSLSMTHFVLLDILLRDLPELAESDVNSLMLRGALEYNQQIDTWWKQSNDKERQRAVWHAVAHGDDPVRLHAIGLSVTTSWVHDVSLETINNVGKRVMPVSEFTPTGLEFLERALPTRDTWQIDDALIQTDDNLLALAVSSSPLADRAAALIGTGHRTRAMLALPKGFNQAHPILVAYEQAGNLPGQMRFADQLKLILLLAGQQLTRNPVEALSHYGWAALGNSLALGLMIYVTFRAADPNNVLSNARLLNTLGLGLLFGMIFGAGVWTVRHIGQRLQVAPFEIRAILAVLIGGAIVAAAIGLFQQLVYDDIIEPGVSITSGILYVLGFAISVEMPDILQVLLGAAGVIAAFLIPWQSYLADNDMRPPFVFDETQPGRAIVLIIAASLILALTVKGYRWREVLHRSLPPELAGK